MWTYDVSNDQGKVRLMITDIRSDVPYFQDEEIQAFLDMNDSSIRYAAADAIEAIATNEALIQKVMKTLDVETDGSKLAAALMARAKSLRDAEEAQGSFDIAEQVQDEFSARERWIKQLQRGAF